jgi:amidohydrolase
MTNISEKNIINWRHHLHQNPELSFNEVQTSQFIYDTLKTFPNLTTIVRPTATSVIATLDTGKPGKTIGLRADIDALPILEETDIPFKSVNDGVMHACGHDCHTAILLGTAETLAAIKDELTGKVVFIFQHAEEVPPGGAREIVATGILDDLDLVFGLHVINEKTGTIGYRYGMPNANSDRFTLKIQGRGGHAANPDKAIDPVLISTELVNSLYHIVARNVDPFDQAVLTVGEISSGDVANIIPDTATVKATIRTTSKTTRKLMEAKIRATIDAIVTMHGATYEIDFTHGYSAVTNDDAAVDMMLKVANEVVGAENIYVSPQGMGGEDFSAYTDKFPGCFYYIGVGGKADGYNYGVHHPLFKVDEAGLITGAKMHVELIKSILGSK